MKNKLTTLGLGISSLFFLGFSENKDLDTPKFDYKVQLEKASFMIQHAMNSTPIQYVEDANNFRALLSYHKLYGEFEIAVLPTILNSHQGYYLIILKMNGGVAAEIFYTWEKALTDIGIDYYDLGIRALSAASSTHPDLNYFCAFNNISKHDLQILKDFICSQATDYPTLNNIKLNMNCKIKKNRAYFSNVVLTSKGNSKKTANFNTAINLNFIKNVFIYILSYK